MSLLLNGDCLELMKDIEDKSVDLIFCDLPYGQTSCKWDCCIDLELFWKQVMRIKKLNTPIFFTTTTKFGVSLINSAPKKCFFRYDIVWVKSAPAGFLSAKKMPMRKHEMIYVFYEKLPFYDLSSHKHKFIKEDKVIRTDEGCNGLYGKETGKIMIYDKDGKTRNAEPRYDPPLPVSVVKEETGGATMDTLYGEIKIKELDKPRKDRTSAYDPPLPVSVVKEELAEGQTLGDKGNECYEKLPFYDLSSHTHKFIKEECTTVKEIDNNNIYRGGTGKPLNIRPKYSKDYDGKTAYDPPLPVSVVKEEKDADCYNFTNRLNNGKLQNYDKELYIGRNGGTAYDPPLPVSVVKEETGGATGTDVYDATERFKNGKLKKHARNLQKGDDPIYDPPLPTTMLEIKSTRGKHSTEKPVALMEWVLKYYSKEGDVILDPTMGSGSTGVACKNMNRNFIGIEMDKEIYEVAVNRIED